MGGRIGQGKRWCFDLNQLLRGVLSVGTTPEESLAGGEAGHAALIEWCSLGHLS